MKKLMNLAIASHLYENDFKSDFNSIREFLNSSKLDGLEIILYGDYKLEAMDKELTVGHHLLYWPYWLDLWKGNNKELERQFLSIENLNDYYGFNTKQAMVDYIRSEFEVAKKLNVEYMVFHVSNVRFSEVFTFEHGNTDLEVMTAAAELINEVFVGDGPMLLFENLWWPGLTFRDKALTEEFLEMINYKNKGYLLDIAHLLATNHQISTEDEAIDYVHECLDDLGDLTKYIKTIHLSKSIAGPYLRSDHSDKINEFSNRKVFTDGFKPIYNHIKHIDAHKPFDNIRVLEIINRIKPDYLVYEFMAKDLEELKDMINMQNSIFEN